MGKMTAAKPNNTQDLDDTLPVELLDCVDTTTNEDWLTRETPQPRKVIMLQERIRSDSSGFNPPLSSTRYQSDGSSSEFSDLSTAAECGSAYEDDIFSAASQRKCPSLLPAASMEFQPLRCSTAVTTNDLVAVALPQPLQHFEIRVDTNEFKSPRVKPVQRTDSIEFNPLRCSTGISELRPKTPEEFHTCAGNTITRDSSDFVTALGFSQGTVNSCAEIGTSPIVQVSKDPVNKAAGVDDDLSIMMQCHLKIRNGRQIISNVQARPQIEFSVFRNSPAANSAVSEVVEGKLIPPQGGSKVPTKRTTNQQNNCPQPSTSNGKLVEAESRIKSNLQETNKKAPPGTLPKSKLLRPSDPQKGKSSRGTSPGDSDSRRSPGDQNRIHRAVENLASTNNQRVLSAFATLDSARSDHLCEALVELNLIDHIFDFLAKMNRSVVHQTACGHATSLLLDLSKYSYSAELTWQNGKRVGLLFNLMSIWVSKDNSIFLNCATILWVFCQDQTRANVLRNFLTTQTKILEKISVKLSTKILRPPTEVPTLEPSWKNSRALRTFKTPCSAFSGLSNALKQSTPRLH